MHTEVVHKPCKFCNNGARTHSLGAIILLKFKIFTVLVAVNPHP